MIKKKIIYGCESRGDGDSPYLTRYELLNGRFGKLYLHVFHRSDADDLHDHPWDFVSLILWRGYIEEIGMFPWIGATPEQQDIEHHRRRKRAWPGMILRRRAEHAHRVELINGKPAVTLVWSRPDRREWGFFTGRGWQRFREYFEERGC